jgi:hypothetical protein
MACERAWMLAREAGGQQRAEGAGARRTRSSAMTARSNKSATRQTSEGESQDLKSEHEGEGWVLGWGPRGCG